jgi:hypothetical protein
MRALKLVDRSDPVTSLIAKKIIDLRAEANATQQSGRAGFLGSSRTPLIVTFDVMRFVQSSMPTTGVNGALGASCHFRLDEWAAGPNRPPFAEPGKVTSADLGAS